MVTLPAEGRWSIRSIAEGDTARVLAFLSHDPLINIYLTSRLLEERHPSATQIVCVLFNGEIVLVASLATNIVLAAAPDVPHDVTESAIALLADRIITRMLPVRAIISPAELVESLWLRLRTRIDPPIVVRMTQPIYAAAVHNGFPDLVAVRYSQLRDLDALVPACAAMHREEVGIDPLDRDALGYRERIRELIEKRRSLVLIESGAIAAKCELSAVTPDAVQLMGVWTAPQFRRQGFARRLLREVCGHLFRDGKTVTLFVNDFNKPAIDLYESLGFQSIGVNRALIW